MKTKITSLVVMAMIAFTTTFATNIPGNINRKVLTTFSERFSDAREVSWSRTEDYIKASFKMNEQIMFAYFTDAGDLMGVSRNLLSNQLPIKLQTGMKKELAGGWITELFEFSTEEETSYYATIENADQKIWLKSIGSYSWMVSKKIKKD